MESVPFLLFYSLVILLSDGSGELGAGLTLI